MLTTSCLQGESRSLLQNCLANQVQVELQLLAYPQPCCQSTNPIAKDLTVGKYEIAPPSNDD